MEEATWQGKRVASESWEWAPADSQPGNGDLRPTTSRNWILPTKGMNLEAYISRAEPTSRQELSPANTLILAL